MNEKTRERWQRELADLLEPGERVQAATRAIQAKFWQMALLYGYVLLAIQKRYRTYVVTDRNVYVFQASSMSKYKVTATLEKRPLGTARIEFDRGYLSLDGAHVCFVGFAGPVKRGAQAVSDAAGAPAVAAAAV